MDGGIKKDMAVADLSEEMVVAKLINISLIKGQGNNSKDKSNNELSKISIF